MLAASPVHVALPARDLDRARRFYADVLGLAPARSGPEGLWYRLDGGTAMLLFPSEVEGRAGHTQAGFEVPDVAAAVAALAERGVAADGVATYEAGTTAAWFRDSEGNLLALVHHA